MSRIQIEAGIPARILLIEDDMVDVKAMKRALTRVGLQDSLRVATEGQEALELLRGRGECATLDRPFIIVLDLNMPRMNGFEVLAELRSDPRLKDIVVFTLTTSRDRQDQKRAYEYNVAGYFVKSDARDIYGGFASMLEQYLALVDLPDE